jgi:energy-coupling factor transport system ATP-binding protein
MLVLDRVSYTYPGAARPVLDDLSLEICEGEFLLVCGPSGSGKSTLLRLLNGLVPHFHGGRFGGDVRVWGRSTRAHQPRDLADLVGFVFQDPEAQFVVDLVEDEIVFAMENLGLPRALMRRRVEEVLDQLGIAHLRRRRVATLSGGEQQRVAIAAVLAAQPRALVLDEPTSQIDPHAAEEVLSALQKLNDDLGLTVVLCEHRLERVVQYADRVLFLPGAGADGPARPLLGAPREVLAEIDLAPPLLRLGRALGWSPLPLTIKEGRRLAAADQRPTINNQRPTPETRGILGGFPPHLPSPTLSGRPVAEQHNFSIHNSPFSIQIDRVRYSYGAHEALYDLSLEARAGEVLALMGRNGSGKTTLLKLLAGLLRPQAGALRVLGRDVARMEVAEVGQLVGYVPQNPRAMLFHDTLREELEFTLAARGAAPASGRAAQVETALERFGLAHRAGAYPRDLSGGEAQRAALAAILVAGPPVLLLDEPTRGLDAPAKDRLGRLLRGLAGAGQTVVLATHDVELVAAFADRAALLGDGELVVEGPVREVLSDSLIFSSQIAKLFPGSGWLTVEDALA